MKKQLGGWIAMLLMGPGLTMQAQNDGDHCITNNAGQTFLATDQQILINNNPLTPTPPVNMTIGTAGSGFATLRSRGDQLPVFDQFVGTSLCTFRTDVPAGNNQNWSMVRGALEIGRFSHTNPNNSFTVQVRQNNGALWLRNWDPVFGGLGAIRLAFDGNGAGGTNTVNGFVHNPIGWAQLGAVAGINTVNPWARFSLMHENMGATLPTTCFRPWFDNAVLGMGNSDLFYFGHKYAMTGGTGAEQDENSAVVAAWGEPNLPAGLGHHFDNFQFRFIGATEATSTAGSIDGLELMRLRPFRAAANDPVQGFVGIGDWSAAATGPEEKLDLLDRTIRLRDFTHPTRYRTDVYDRVLVADPSDGRVYWRPWPTAGLADCDWETPNAALKLLHTARLAPTANPTCPEEDWRVSIGTLANVQSKLKVYGRTSVGGHTGAIQAEFQPSASAGGSGVSATVSHETSGSAIAGDAIGVDGYALGSGFRGYGVRGTATALGSNTTEVNGASGFATLLSGSSTARTFGLRSEVDVNNGASGTEVYGSFSKVFGTGNVTGNMTGVLGWCNPLGGTIFSLYGGDLSADWGANTNVTNSTGLLVKSTTLGTNYADNSIGVDASAYGGDVRTLGVQSVAHGVGSSETTGVKGTAQGQVPLATGVFGKAQNVIDGSSVTRIGVRGSLFPVTPSDLLSAHASILGDFAGNGVEQWSGFFDGKVGAAGTITAGVVSVFSDESIKTDVQAMEDQTGNLMALQPRTFQYTDEARQRLNLPEGVQPGFMAPEVQEVFPVLVSEVTMMARLDSLGNEIAPSLPIHAVNYTGLVPVLVSGHQQQENRLAAVENQLAQVLEQLAACCAASDGTRAPAGGTNSGAALDNDLRIVPNPVADRTELRYTVANEGRVRLEITDTSSRIVLTREEGQRSAGSFLYEWDTTLLSPGTYICTLYINDEFLVKKSVKLGTR